MSTTEDALRGGLKGRVQTELETLAPRLLELSHAIHARPELAWQERYASNLIAETLRHAGFVVRTGAYGIETAVDAVYGDGDLTVAICAEYDALPQLGHACGHNVIAAAGVGAALALVPIADAAGLRVKLLGTPAEEHGAGKVPMLAAGAWDDVHFSMMVHGMPQPDRPGDAFHATGAEEFTVTFTGRPAHAAGSPETGINAGAAASLAITAMAHLRQHIEAGANINAFISFGGEATNIIPSRTLVEVEVRAPEIDYQRQLKERVLACFEGAAIATGCSWSWEQLLPPYEPLLNDPELTRLWDKNLQSCGRTLEEVAVSGGSTDMGNVSQAVPSIHPSIAFLGIDATPHTPEFAVAAAGDAGDAAVIDGALSLALTALDVACEQSLRSELIRRKENRLGGEK